MLRVHARPTDAMTPDPRHATARIPASATRLALTITMIHPATHLQHTRNIHNMTTILLHRPSCCTCTPTARTHSHARAHPRPLQPTTASRRDSASRREGPYKGKRPLNAQHKAQYNAQSAHINAKIAEPADFGQNCSHETKPRHLLTTPSFARDHRSNKNDELGDHRAHRRLQPRPLRRTSP